MIIKKKAPAKAKAGKKVKQGKNTKIIVGIEFKARQNGKNIALDWLPDDVQKLIICKIAAFEIQLEALLNDAAKEDVCHV